MVRTRGTAQRERATMEEKMADEDDTDVKSNVFPGTSNKLVTKSENLPASQSRDLRSKKSSISSISKMYEAKKKLEMHAVQEKARIEKELVDKRLQADLAILEHRYSPHASEADSQDHKKDKDIEQWLERSKLEQEKQRITYDGIKEGSLLPPPGEGGTIGPVHQLASALKDILATSGPTVQNANLLSRLSTPRELPIFYGDHMEWLHFKRAYEDSSELCNFSDTENIWRLRRCLRGAAKEAVSALLISNVSSSKVMTTLEMVFGNPDVIITKIMMEVKKLQPLSTDYHKDIINFSVKIRNFVAAVQALQREEYLYGVDMLNIILSKMPTILISKWSDYSYYKITSNTEKCKFKLLADFLEEEALKISTCSANLLNTRLDYKRRNYQALTETHNILVNSEHENKSEIMCKYCRLSKHTLIDCKRFKRSLRKDRWSFVKRMGICFKCLLARHDRLTCPAAVCDMKGCGQSHHRLLHISNSFKSNSLAVVNNNSTSQTESSENSEIVTHINLNICSVLLKVVPINIHGPNGKFSVYALIDDGSTVSMISASLAARVGLQGQKQCIRMRGPWDNSELECETEIVDLTFSNKYNKQFNIKVRSVKELCLPTQLINCKNYKHLNYLLDELCTGLIKPEVLIGQDNCHLLLPLEVVTGKPNEPCATRTPIGWCVHGRVPRTSASSQASHSTLFISEDVTCGNEDRRLQDLHDHVRTFFSVESLGISSKPRQNVEEQRAWERLEQTSIYKEGRWEVGLPWKDTSCVLPDSFPNAVRRLCGVEKKMKNNLEYAQRYQERVRHLLINNYAKELTDTNNTIKTWYLPHFGVDNPNKKKLRLVFDAAALSSGLSLNDYLYKGPDLLTSLFGIMLRFREEKIAVTGDIKDMFLRIKIRQEDQNALRFLFRGNPYDSFNPQMLQEPTKTYVMTSLIFGANCSPFIAQFIKNKNAQRYESSMQAAAEAIRTQHYMDDYIDSLPDEETASQRVKEISYIHSQGGFEIRNWNCNSETVLSSIPKESLGDSAVRFKIGQQYEGERILGLLWHTANDTLQFDISFKKLPKQLINGLQKPTKRDMLKVVMSIFDIYGILSPFTINGKILLQETWQLKIDWDESVSDDIFAKWKVWISLFKTLDNVRLQRYYSSAADVVGAREMKHRTGDIESATSEAPTRATIVAKSASATQNEINNNHVTMNTSCYTHLQLHIFCDASSKAYCAVAYWRWKDNKNITRVAFIASKCRVAGIKPITIPRLELQAALLAARLADSIGKAHRITASKRIFWSDSTTVLHWIYNNTRNYEVFIANRLGEIDEYTDINEWRYIPTKLNIADYATREIIDSSILNSQWLNGPTFLSNDEENWPQGIVEQIDHTFECVTALQEDNIIDLPVPESTKFSSWLRLLRSTSRVLLFIDKLILANNKKRSKFLTYDLETCVMERAERLLLKCSQCQSFNKEINYLKNNKSILTSSKLLTLSPFLDKHGVLRAYSRIQAATDVPPETKTPVILDGGNYISRLIIRHYHIRAAHGNQEMVVNNLKQKYFIFRIRPTVKSVVSRCMFCRLRKCKPEIPRMGDLPAPRMAHHHRPFSFCGVDLFGPMEVTVGRRREKRYGVLFTCLTVRAIHIEVVASLSTDSFLMALRRMAARRGWPQNLYSDNGTNLRGANTELKKAIKEMDQNALKDEALNFGTKWSFIPPASPHWGGAWERLIRSVKTSLQVILKERAPREETLMTLITEVESIINSRPLTHVSVEPGSMEALTPAHFLLGTASMLPQNGIFKDTDFYLNKQWRISQRLADMFWQRWVREILPNMVPRKKWLTDQRPLQTGDLVYLVEPNGPRNMWSKGIIQEVYPGKDGRVRTIKIKTKNGVLIRSTNCVARIPIEAECC